MTNQPAPNRLIDQTSPYLLQHAHNPVDWYPWGPEALERARAEDKPILLSIGYAACHWCHVMAHESFEDAETAAQMNRDFVCVKVDREERPDLDGIYMDAVQAMTGHGGWPMTVFLTPEGGPFYAGTYYPKVDRPGMPSFRRVLAAVADAWARRRDDARRQGDQVVQVLAAQSGALGGEGDGQLADETLGQAFEGLRGAFDAHLGRVRGRAQVPPADDARVPAPLPPARLLGGAGHGPADPGPDGRRRHLRPARRRLPPLLDRRALAGPALREDAVRQRPAGPPLHPRLAGHRRGPLPGGGRPHRRLPAARAAPRRRRVLLLPGRRLRGGRGPLLRLVLGGAGRDRRRAGGPPPRRRPRGQLGGDQRPLDPAPGPRRRAGGRGGGRAAAAARGPRGPGPPGHRRQGAGRLERPGHLGPGRGRPQLRRAPLHRGRPGRGRLRAGGAARRAAGGCCAPGATAAPAGRATWTTTPAWPRPA